MTSHNFGSTHTKTKLDLLVDYLEFYTKALSRQNFELIYFDAFAGTGSIDLTPSSTSDDQTDLLEDAEDLEPIIDGSARRALKIERPFDRYIFVESDTRKVSELERLRTEFKDVSNRVSIQQGDANAHLIRFCENTNWTNTRAVVFLDPYGSQASWETIVAIGKTKAIDLWYLFPSFMCVYRQISKDGRMTPEQVNSIERILGTSDWQSNWITTEYQNDLFGEAMPVSKKQGTIDDVTKFMIDRMKSEFRGGVLDSWLPLGPKGQHWYSLIFACANPSAKASGLAKKLASYLMDRN